MSRPRFHLAFPVHDLAAARAFYGGVLGCPEGRSSDHWVDFDLYGHQIVAHLSPDETGHRATSAVDGHEVPVRHFGLLLDIPRWEQLVARLRAAGTAWVIEPYVRFAGGPGEQHTCFLLDPSGNALEFKAFADERAIFATAPLADAARATPATPPPPTDADAAEPAGTPAGPHIAGRG
ncbi:MAG: VOC family protein [Acidimicrobiales bacterium]